MAAQTTNISSDLVWQLTRMLHPFFFYFSLRKTLHPAIPENRKKDQFDRLPTFHSTRHHFFFFFFFRRIY